MKKTLAFDTAVVIESGMAYYHFFREGEVYPILGLNNGVQIGFNNHNDADSLVCHNFGDVLAPVGRDTFRPKHYDDERFSHQGGDIPPLFDYCNLKIKKKRKEG